MTRRHSGTCVFCGRSGRLTKEDLISTWVGKEIRRLHGDPRTLSIELDANQQGLVSQHQKVVGSASSIKLPLVCEPCNKKWMSKIELDASSVLRPTLSGGSVTITPAQQKVIARWATLKALTCDLRRPNASPVVFPDDLHAFYATRNPAQQFQVWMAEYRGHLDHIVWFARWATLTDTAFKGLPARTPHGQVFTLVFGHLVMQSVFVGLRGREIPLGYQRNESDDAVRVWPAPGGENPLAARGTDGW